MPLSTETQKLIETAEELTQLPIEVEFDESFRPYEGVSRVATKESPKHQIIVRDETQESVIWHEIGHIERMMWTPLEERKVVFMTPRAIEDLVGMGFAEILNGIVGHIHRTVRNSVPDILIEHRILHSAPPPVLKQQVESFIASSREQAEACVKLSQSSHYSSLQPFVVMLGAYALFGGRVAGIHLDGGSKKPADTESNPIGETGQGKGADEIPSARAGSSKKLWAESRDLMTRLEGQGPRHEGEDIAFIENWLQQWKVGDWFFWEPIEYDLPYLPEAGIMSPRPPGSNISLKVEPKT